MNSGWIVFNSNVTSGTTTNTLLTSDSSTYQANLGSYPYAAPPQQRWEEATEKPIDPLDWLHDRVGAICNLGYLQ